VKRTVDAYYKISISNIKLKVHKAQLKKQVELRIVPHEKIEMSELRIWYKNILTDVYHIKNSDLNNSEILKFTNREKFIKSLSQKEVMSLAFFIKNIKK